MAPVGKVPAAIPTTYIESGTVASEISGASVAPTIEPVAKITAELAPVSACAAASRTTLDRARASSEISSAAVMSIIGHFRPGAARAEWNRPVDSRHYVWGASARSTDANGRALCIAVQAAFGRPNTRIRLLAGISTISDQRQTGSFAASFSRASISRTPHSAFRSRRLLSNTALLIAVCLPPRLNGP